MSYTKHVISTYDEKLTSGFRTKDRPTHNGVDYTAVCDKQVSPRGVDILALDDGTVTNIYYNSARGNVIDIAAHNSRITTRYQHLRNGITLKVGDKVKRGEAIAVMGNTGSCSSWRTDVEKAYLGTHLHLEVIVDGAPVNPEPYLTGAKSIGSGPTMSAKPADTAQSTATTQANPQGSTAYGTSSVMFNVGDKVKILLTAKNYTGASFDTPIPDRYKSIPLTITQVSKDGKSVLLKELFSWVWVNDVAKA